MIMKLKKRLSIEYLEVLEASLGLFRGFGGFQGSSRGASGRFMRFLGVFITVRFGAFQRIPEVSRVSQGHSRGPQRHFRGSQGYSRKSQRHFRRSQGVLREFHGTQEHEQRLSGVFRGTSKFQQYFRKSQGIIGRGVSGARRSHRVLERL